MAKVAFSKLGLKVNNEIKTVEFNEQTIEVKQYLPVNDKLELISNVINLSADDNNFANPVKIAIFTALEILYNYTNLTFTEKQKEDPTKLFDLVISNGLVKEVVNAMDKAEYDDLISAIQRSVNAVYDYRNSVFGILDAITTDYSNLNLDALSIQQTLTNPENLDLLKQVLTKLG